MSSSKPRRQVPRLALRAAEAAEAIGVSVDHFERHVQGELRCIYSGRLRLFPVSELERWVVINALPAVAVTAGGSRGRMNSGVS